MASMIYEVGRNGIRWIGYVHKEKPISKPKEKPKALNSHFSYAYTQRDNSAPRPKGSKNSARTNKKGTKVFKDKIIYVTYILSSLVETPIMVPGLWVLTTHDGNKAYVPRPGT